jgi:hypothetical protein
VLLREEELPELLRFKLPREIGVMNLDIFRLDLLFFKLRQNRLQRILLSRLSLIHPI